MLFQALENQIAFLRKKSMTLSFMQTLTVGPSCSSFPATLPLPFLLLIHQAFIQQPLLENILCTCLFSKCWGQSGEQNKPEPLPYRAPSFRGEVNYTKNDKCCQWGLLWRNMRQRKWREILREGSLSFWWHVQGRPLTWGRWGKSWQTAERPEGEHSGERNSKCQLLF